MRNNEIYVDIYSRVPNIIRFNRILAWCVENMEHDFKFWYGIRDFEQDWELIYADKDLYDSYNPMLDWSLDYFIIDMENESDRKKFIFQYDDFICDPDSDILDSTIKSLDFQT